MTEDQKESLIAKMLDAPSTLSGAELEAILYDDELRDIYEASAALSGACCRQPQLDMRAEWARFRPLLRRQPAARRWSIRVAAIFFGVILASGIAVRIIDNVFSNKPSRAIVNAEPPAEAKPAAIICPAPLAPQINTGKTESVPANEGHHRAPARHHLAQAETAPATEAAATVEPDIDIDEYLRLQQARVGNDLALQAAQSFAQEYDELTAILDAVGARDAALDNAIRKVTME